MPTNLACLYHIPVKILDPQKTHKNTDTGTHVA